MSESVRGVETAGSPATAESPAVVESRVPVELSRVRQLWHLLEPLHAVLYYAPEVFEEAAALGYDTEERWPSYFPLRAAPLGPVGGERVASAFYSFSPRMVAEHMDPAWSIASPDAVLKARLRGMDRAYRAIFGDRVDSPELAEAAALARRAAEAANTAGRPLAAANAELAWPAEPHLQLWQAATILREHRGDGHLAALLVARPRPRRGPGLLRRDRSRLRPALREPGLEPGGVDGGPRTPGRPRRHRRQGYGDQGGP